jgi:hypothetical protein
VSGDDHGHMGEATCICDDVLGAGWCYGIPGETDECKPCLALDPDRHCLRCPCCPEVSS